MMCSGLQGGEALRACEQSVQPYHVIISDLSMPEMGGLEFIEALSASGYSGSRILISTGLPDFNPDRQAVEIDGVLSKPFNMEALRRELAALQLSSRSV